VAVAVVIAVVVVVLIIVVEGADLLVEKTMAVSFTWISWKRSDREGEERLLVAPSHILWMTLTLALLLLLILL
jgi:hypothetical protein